MGDTQTLKDVPAGSALHLEDDMRWDIQPAVREEMRRLRRLVEELSRKIYNSPRIDEQSEKVKTVDWSAVFAQW